MAALSSAHCRPEHGGNPTRSGNWAAPTVANEGPRHVFWGPILMQDNDLLFAIDGMDVTIFASRDDASGWLEAPDVARGVYRVFTQSGTELLVAAERGRVVVIDVIRGDYAEA